MPKATLTLCPCESGQVYVRCCEPYHLGATVPTAVALMRSRYVAYYLGLEVYLLKTWHPDTRPLKLDLFEIENVRWIGLQVKSTQMLDDRTATVAFVARYKVAGKAERLVENSLFKRDGESWFYWAAVEAENLL
ncbi:MAG: hypothetical protein HOP21_08615 [Methylotenera sp.]|nr:hypothetical protein [Methylotenera sp.]